MSYIAQRREEEKERRRSEILDAAETLYRESSWDAATIDEVARRARLSRALVYVYFKDKADLHFAIVERALRALGDRFEQAVSEHETGREQVEAIGRAYVAYARETPHYFHACSHFQAHEAAAEGADTNEAAALRAGARVHQVLAEALAAGKKDGTVRKDLGDPMMTAVALWGFTHGIIQIATTKGVQLRALGVEVPALIEHAFDLLTKSLSSMKRR
jgi:TetR/AcrR family transcriptional regulator